ncbi:MAG: hypothetical protein WCL39_12230, partial [Armatimonadota bacterium]
MNKTLSGALAAYVQYDRQANKLYLRNDANTAWLGPLTPGAGTLENSFCKLDGVLTTISSTQNTVKINWRLFLKNAVLGKTLGGWMYVADQFGMTAGWDKRATYPIGSTPVNVSATPTSGSFETGQKTTLTTKYSDADGVANVADAYLLVNDIAVSDGLYLLYSSTANKLFIRSTNDTQWLPAGGVTPGSGAAVSSDYGTLYPSETTVTKSGNELIVNWRVSFGSGLGDKTVKHWLYVQDAGGSTDGWDGFGSLSITLPVEVSDIVLVPESIVLGENDSYTLRAAILDEFGQVASRAVTPTWSTDAAGTATVTPIGLEGTGEYHAATVTAVGGSAANIKATAGTKEYTAAVTVYDLSSYGKMVENGAWFPGESAPYNESVYYYFYATPGRRYRVSLQNTLGTLDLEVYTDANSPSTSLVDSRRIYKGDYGEVVFTAGSLHSTYFVRAIGVMANNTFDLWTDSSASDYHLPVPYAYASIDPNGQALHRLTGVNEDSYYRFECVANRQYGLLVDSNSIVKITNAASQSLATRTAVAGTPVLVSFKPTTAGSVFIKLEHYGDSTLGTSLRLVMPDTETVSGENLALMPGRLSLLPGDTRTGLQSLLASYLATTGLPSMNSALLSWGTDKARLTITSGAITADGKYATGALSAATNQALREAASVVVRKASTGAEDYSVVDLLGNNEVVKLVLNTPKANNIAQYGEKGYLLSTTAGVMYTLTFVPGSGSTAVTIAADPASFDIIDTFDVKSVTKTYSFISPRRFGTVYVRLRGKESTNTVTVTAAQTADTLQYPVPGSWNRLVVNAVAFNGKLGSYSLGRGLDDETALFTFDTLRAGTYIVEVTCVAGTGPVKWQVTGNLSIVPSSASLTSTGGTTRKYNLTSTAAGQRNW